MRSRREINLASRISLWLGSFIVLYTAQ